MEESNDNVKTRLRLLIDAGQVILDASKEGGERIDASTLCSFLREYIDERDVAYQSALKDMESQNWIGKANYKSESEGSQ